MFLLTLFYTKKQMALRAAILYTGSQFGNAFGGLFALACMQLEGYRGLRGWRWLFIVEGRWHDVSDLLTSRSPYRCRGLRLRLDHP